MFPLIKKSIILYVQLEAEEPLTANLASLQGGHGRWSWQMALNYILRSFGELKLSKNTWNTFCFNKRTK